MLAYNKLIVAIASVVVTRLVLRWTGIDVNTLGIDTEFREMIALVVDAAVAGVTGFLVWWVPNVRARLRDRLAQIKAWF